MSSLFESRRLSQALRAVSSGMLAPLAPPPVKPPTVERRPVGLRIEAIELDGRRYAVLHTSAEYGVWLLSDVAAWLEANPRLGLSTLYASGEGELSARDEDLGAAVCAHMGWQS
jgi:hypothetical protein